MEDTRLPLHHVVGHSLVGRQSGDNTTMTYPPGFYAESRASQMVIGIAACQIVGTLFVIARVYARIFIVGHWRSDDWVLITGLLFATGYSICQYGQVGHGAGRHVVTITNVQDSIDSQKYAFAAILLLFEAIALPKLSICLSYLRIFYSDKTGRRLIQGLMVFVFLSIVPFFIETLFTCNPLHVYWSELRPDDKCLPEKYSFYTNGALNIAIDIALMAILIPRIMGLKLNNRQKYALLGIVMLGSLAVIAGIVRMIKVGSALAKVGSGNYDAPWETYDISIWTCVEIYVTLICAAAPGVKPLVSRLLPHLLGTSQRSHTRTNTNPIEMNSRLKRSTLGTTGPSDKSGSMTGLTAADGPYTEVGRGADEDSIGGKSEEERYGQSRSPTQIVKMTEVTVHSSETRQ